MKMLANYLLVKPEAWSERKAGKIIIPSGDQRSCPRRGNSRRSWSTFGEWAVLYG